MMIKVVNGFKSLSNRLRALTPINVIKSRTASPDLFSELMSNKGSQSSSPILTEFACTVYSLISCCVSIAPFLAVTPDCTP